jgi:hypothetical protein
MSLPSQKINNSEDDWGLPRVWWPYHSRDQAAHCEQLVPRKVCLGPAARHSTLILLWKADALERAHIAEMKSGPGAEAWRAGLGFFENEFGIMDDVVNNMVQW